MTYKMQRGIYILTQIAPPDPSINSRLQNTPTAVGIWPWNLMTDSLSIILWRFWEYLPSLSSFVWQFLGIDGFYKMANEK